MLSPSNIYTMFMGWPGGDMMMKPHAFIGKEYFALWRIVYMHGFNWLENANFSYNFIYNS
jgi:hypothetical protein